jgi:DNA-binding SARP family transcriptional activator
LCEAAVAVAEGDDGAAAEVLGAYLERSPAVGTGLDAFPQLRTLALWYVLAPSSRTAWDGFTLGPAFAVARDLARRLLRLRTEGAAAAGPPPPLPAPEVVRSVLPLPWLIEVALAEAAAGRNDGWALLESVWPQAQPAVRRHAVSGPSPPLAKAARVALGRLPVPPTGRLELRLLGPIELTRDGQAVDAPEWRRQRVRALLAALVLQRPVARERLADDLWPDLDARAQSRNLRVTLSHLLRVLEPARGDRDASFLVRPHGPSLLLHAGDWFTTDLWRFDTLWEQATTADADGVPSAALAAMGKAVALWRSDPVELAANDWALPEVEERRLRMVRMAGRAGELLLARGDTEAARQMAEAALRCDPWVERAHHVVVGAHRAAGNHRAARAAEERYREALTELGGVARTVAG